MISDRRIFLLLTVITLLLTEKQICATPTSHTDATSNTSEEECICISNETVSTTREHLQTLLRMISVKLISPISNLALTANDEIRWLLDRSRFRIITESDLVFHPILSVHKFSASLDNLIFNIQTMLMDKKNTTTNDLESFLRRELNSFFEGIFPSVFLCISMGKCVAPHSEYTKCLQLSAADLAPKLFGEPRVAKMSRTLGIPLSHYKSILNLTQKLHKLALDADSHVTDDCVRRMAEVTKCDSCATAGIGYCRPSCEHAVEYCLGSLPTLWDSQISLLRTLVDDFDGGFEQLETGIVDAIIVASEENSPRVAKDIYSRCGPFKSSLQEQQDNNWTKQFAPKSSRRGTVEGIKKISMYQGYWSRLPLKMCEKPSNEPLCWNGFRHIKSEYDDYGNYILKKNVAPPARTLRPIIPARVEVAEVYEGSSGTKNWAFPDDEDFGGSGSGDDSTTDTFPQTTVTIEAPLDIFEKTEGRGDEISEEVENSVVETEDKSSPRQQSKISMSHSEQAFKFSLVSAFLMVFA